MKDIEEIAEHLPKIDCGSCGAPTCMAFAEDIVKGETTADECTVIMRQIFHQYIEEHKGKSLLDEFNIKAGKYENNKRSERDTDKTGGDGNEIV